MVVPESFHALIYCPVIIHFLYDMLMSSHMAQCGKQTCHYSFVWSKIRNIKLLKRFEYFPWRMAFPLGDGTLWALQVPHSARQQTFKLWLGRCLSKNLTNRLVFSEFKLSKKIDLTFYILTKKPTYKWNWNNNMSNMSHNMSVSWIIVCIHIYFFEFRLRPCHRRSSCHHPPPDRPRDVVRWVTS